jgi:hypothetical protein
LQLCGLPIESKQNGKIHSVGYWTGRNWKGGLTHQSFNPNSSILVDVLSNHSRSLSYFQTGCGRILFRLINSHSPQHVANLDPAAETCNYNAIFGLSISFRLLIKCRYQRLNFLRRCDGVTQLWTKWWFSLLYGVSLLDFGKILLKYSQVSSPKQ